MSNDRVSKWNKAASNLDDFAKAEREREEREKREKWLASERGKAVITALQEWEAFWAGDEGRAARFLLIAGSRIHGSEDQNQLVLASGDDLDGREWLGVLTWEGLKVRSLAAPFICSIF